MNADIRRRTSIAGAVLALIAALAIAPEAATNLVVHHAATRELWWTLLVAAFVVLALLVEALELGRKPPHRRRVDHVIVEEIIRNACSNPECPMVTAPNDSARRAAKAIFYDRIDMPSREVSFYQWGWLYTGLIWTWLALAALLVAFTLTWFKATENDGLRWSAIGILAAAALVAYTITQIWEGKTLSHVELQLIQIRAKIGSRLEGVDCPNPACPAR